MTTKIIIPAIGIPSAFLILASFTTEPTVMLAILMHIALASCNIFLTNKNREFKFFGRSIRSRDDGFDFSRWMINLVLLDPVLYFLLDPTPTVHFACWTMLAVAAMIDTYKKSYRFTIVVTAAIMFFVSHSIIFPKVSVVEKILLTSVMCSFLFVMWAIESRFLVSMIKEAEKSETVMRQEAELEKMESEAAFGKSLRIFSHEINNVLGVLTMTDPTRHAEIMSRAVSKLRVITDLILEGSSGQRKKTKASVKTLIEEIRILVRPIVTHNNCKWTENIGYTFTDEFYEEYSGAAFLIVQNFVKNAVEEVSKIRGTITLKMVTQEDNIIISVTDNGGGLSKNPFDDIESNVTSKKSGHGLGLKFVSREARKSGFNVGCDPGPMSGATFWLSIRLTRPGELKSATI